MKQMPRKKATSLKKSNKIEQSNWRPLSIMMTLAVSSREEPHHGSPSAGPLEQLQVEPVVREEPAPEGGPQVAFVIGALVPHGVALATLRSKGFHIRTWMSKR